MLHALRVAVAFLLSLEARLVLRRYRPFIIAITGSVGKTSTKEAIACVLHGTARVRKSAKSYNSELGVPLTILDLETGWRNPLRWAVNLIKGFATIFYAPDYPDVLVLEVGADHPGDIRRIARWLKPDIAVLTRLPEFPVHVEHFSSPEEVRKEKAELVRALKPSGVFVANADDEYVMALAKTTPARVVTFGFSSGAAISGSEFAIRYESVRGTEMPVGESFTARYGERGFPVFVRGIVGMHPIYAMLAALATGVARGIGFSHMIDSLKTYQSPPGRMRVLEGVAKSVLIDDSYNSSPVAAEAALALLKEIKGRRKIALLGDMLELGTFTNEEHWRIGRLAGEFVDELVTVGKRAALIAEAAKTVGLPEGRIHQFASSEEAGKWLADRVHEGDIVLVKGSQGSGENAIRMERATKLLMRYPERAEELLVRQEKEWRER